MTLVDHPAVFLPDMLEVLGLARRLTALHLLVQSSWWQVPLFGAVHGSAGGGGNGLPAGSAKVHRVSRNILGQAQSFVRNNVLSIPSVQFKMAARIGFKED